MPPNLPPQNLGPSGRIAGFFLRSQLTPLLAILALLVGLFAVLVTPREEEPQINVTMANVMIPFPGASTNDVESMVAIPAEQVLAQISGVKHVMSVSQSGLAIITVQFEVGVPRIEALVRLHDTVSANADWLPRNLGVLPPIVKPKGIDDVPIIALTLTSAAGTNDRLRLEQTAHRIETELKRVPGTREVTTIGGPQRRIRVEVDPARLTGRGFTLAEVMRTVESANAGAPAGDLLIGDQALAVETGPFLRNAQDVADLIVGVRAGVPVALRDLATVIDGPTQTHRIVWHRARDANGNFTPATPAVTIAITKKPGENAVDVANAVSARVADLKGNLIPSDIQVDVSRNYGATADQKAKQLIQKLLFATVSVVALVYLALGRREAMIVGGAVILTLAATLFASWAYGFTINRVSLFALIFSIGILVDDAIVVVENIHRHQGLYPGRSLFDIIPGAVDEVGGPTILATLTVIAALLPMAFVSGLMGPYMSPIPINASMGMLISLAIAFVITPWMSARWMKSHSIDTIAKTAHSHDAAALTRWLAPRFQQLFRPFLAAHSGKRNRRQLALGVLGAIVISVALPVAGLVVLKMLPFDNKSEFQVVVDLPEGTRVEKTDTVLREMADSLSQHNEVTSLQMYAGTAAPINFNGLVRQYYLRQAPHLGELQVNLVDKSARDDKSHAIATRVRPELTAIAKRHGAAVKIVEVPPGPPVLAPIVAEIYGPSAEARQQLANTVRNTFERTDGLVDVDDSSTAANPKKLLIIDRRKASAMGVPQQAIVETIRAGLSGADSTYLHDGSKYAVAVTLRLSEQQQQSLNALLALPVRSVTRETVPLGQLVTVTDTVRDPVRYRKDLLPVTYVVADVAQRYDSPLYGLFATRSAIMDQSPATDEFFVHQPDNPQVRNAIKWDGEWQITYETFRDMGAAYAVGLVLIYLLVVAQFGSYITPLIIMAPIPLTIIGVMPGHALLGAQFTATSMIGMIALAGIIVRNSILLVDFIHLQLREGKSFEEAVVSSATIRAQPILLTGVAAMLGAFFILDDPIFNGLAISLIFGILVSTVLTLLVIPLLYYSVFSKHHPVHTPS